MTKRKTTTQNIDIQYLTAMLNCIAEGVFTVDAQKRITFFNWAAERLTGFNAEEAIGQPCCDIFRADVCGEPCIQEEVSKGNRTVTERRVHIVSRNGRTVTVSVNAAALKDASGH